MNKPYSYIAACVIAFTIISCSKKTNPTDSPANSNSTNTKSPDSVAVIKKIVPVKAKPLATVPKVIVVNDGSAKKAVDGRLYYDMQGRRYWRSNKDGKYYLYNKSMQTDDAFKAPVKKA